MGWRFCAQARPCLPATDRAHAEADRSARVRRPPGAPEGALDLARDPIDRRGPLPTRPRPRLLARGLAERGWQLLTPLHRFRPALAARLPAGDRTPHLHRPRPVRISLEPGERFR